MQQGHGVQVENGLGTGMVAHLGVVAGQAQDVLDAQGGGAQQVGLQGQTVAVAAGGLVDGGQTGLLHQGAGGQSGGAHDAGLVVGDVHCGDAAEVLLSLLNQVAQMDTLGRANFCGNDKFTVIK